MARVQMLREKEARLLLERAPDTVAENSQPLEQ